MAPNCTGFLRNYSKSLQTVQKCMSQTTNGVINDVLRELKCSKSRSPGLIAFPSVSHAVVIVILFLPRQTPLFLRYWIYTHSIIGRPVDVARYADAAYLPLHRRVVEKDTGDKFRSGCSKRRAQVISLQVLRLVNKTIFRSRTHWILSPISSSYSKCSDFFAKYNKTEIAPIPSLGPRRLVCAVALEFHACP